MAHKATLRAFCAAAVCLLLACCAKPAYYEEFIRADEAESGIYSFTLDLADTLCTYDISFYISPAHAKVPADTSRTCRCLPVYVVWTGPQDESFEEMVYMDPGQTVQPYRQGVEMAVLGDWKLDLRPMEVPSGFRGIGIICHRNDQE